MTLYRNRYRVESARKQGFDYSSAGYYYLTVCTWNKVHLFGEIINHEMVLNEYGDIVHQEWCKSFEIRRELQSDEFIVMPNHIHGIVRIVRPPAEAQSCHNPEIADCSELVSCTGRPLTPKSISSFMAGVKSAITTRINISRGTPGEPVWQSRFYDSIIRDDASLFRVREYIRNNPKEW